MYKESQKNLQIHNRNKKKRKLCINPHFNTVHPHLNHSPFPLKKKQKLVSKKKFNWV